MCVCGEGGCSSDKGEGVKMERAWEGKCLILKKVEGEKHGTAPRSNQHGWRRSPSARLSAERKAGKAFWLLQSGTRGYCHAQLGDVSVQLIYLKRI